MAIKLIRGNAVPLRWTVATAGNFADGSTAGNVNSEWMQLASGAVSLQLLWTGTTAGTLAIELSNDGTNVAHTYAVTDFSPAMTNPAGSAAGTACEMASDFLFFRVTFTRSSGTGKITGTAVEKAS